MKKITFYSLCMIGLNCCNSSNDPVLDATPAPLPEVNAAVFSSPTNITNPYYGPPVGQIYIYEGGEVGLPPEEEIQIERQMEVRDVMGIQCIVHKDIVRLDGVVIEDTDDWLAQDNDGNLWYLGEFVINYEDDGTFADNDGSWEAGIEGALPGYWMPANPQPGETYMQEYWKGEAEDYAEVIGFETVTIALGTFENCLVTKDINPFETDVYEIKYYASGIGFIKEEKFEGGELMEEVELVQINR